MRTILIIVLALSLQGCWFVFIPGSMIQAIGEGVSQMGNTEAVEHEEVGDYK